MSPGKLAGTLNASTEAACGGPAGVHQVQFSSNYFFHLVQLQVTNVNSKNVD